MCLDNERYNEVMVVLDANGKLLRAGDIVRHERLRNLVGKVSKVYKHSIDAHGLVELVEDGEACLRKADSLERIMTAQEHEALCNLRADMARDAHGNRIRIGDKVRRVGHPQATGTVLAIFAKDGRHEVRWKDAGDYGFQMLTNSGDLELDGVGLGQ